MNLLKIQMMKYKNNKNYCGEIKNIHILIIQAK